MLESSDIEHLLSKIKQLDKTDQQRLFQRLSRIIYTENSNETFSSSLLSLAGLGSQLWNGTNIDEYVEQERQW